MGRGLTRLGLILALIWCAGFAVAADGKTVTQATATGVIILAPPSDPPVAPISSPAATLPGTATVTSTNWSTPGSTLAQVDKITSGVTSDGSGIGANSTLTNVQLFGGELTIDTLQVAVKRPPGAPEVVVAQVGTVQLAGSPVTVPDAGADPVPLADWGQLSVGAQQDDGSVAGVLIELTADHGGLAAGSVIELGAVQAVAPASSSGDGGGSGGGSNPGPPPTPTRQAGGHHHHHHHTHTRDHVRRHHHHHRRIDDVHPAALPKLGNGVRAAIVHAAAQQIGWPYVWGGESREEGGFDCSGLVDYAFSAAGHALPGRPTAAVLWHMGIPIKRKDLRPGDLAFLGSKSGQPYHVALYAGGGMVIVASGRGRPIAAEPLDSVDWDGFARIWAPGGQPPIVNPRHSRATNPEARADRIAAARVLRDLGAPVTDSAAVEVVVPPAPHRRPAPARRPRRPARTETPMIVADPRVRPAAVRSAFPLPSA